MFWGYSAAVDFQNELDCWESDEEPINILIVGAGDARHILETISKYYRHKRQVKINFYIAEVLMELIARQLLLLLTAFEPLEMLGLREKVHLWMEIFGNILVRPNTAKYISLKSQQLIETVTDFDYLKYRLPMVNLDLFKYKERDLLEVVFKFWSQENGTYNAIQHWDNRLRKSLGERYDSRKGAYDWDYHMKVRERHHGERINSREYSKWRESGIAFAWLETEMSEKNLTLTNGIFQHQDRILHHGFLGDQVSAPYIAFGLDCEDEEMLTTQNGIHLKRSTDIMFRNLSRMFWEIEHQTPYCHADEKDSLNLGVVVTELTENFQKQIDFEQPSQKVEKSEHLKKEPNKRDNYSSIPLPNFKIKFFPPSTITDLPHKQKFEKFFDLIWISQNLMKKVSTDLFTVAKNGAIVLVENRNYVVSLSKEEFDKTPTEIDSIMKLCSCELVQPFNLNKDAYAKYKFQNKSNGDECVGNADASNELQSENDITKNCMDQSLTNLDNQSETENNSENEN